MSLRTLQSYIFEAAEPNKPVLWAETLSLPLPPERLQYGTHILCLRAL